MTWELVHPSTRVDYDDHFERAERADRPDPWEYDEHPARTPARPIGAACPEHARHTTVLSAGEPWEAWAARMERTHVQERCPGCGVDTVWVPR